MAKSKRMANGKRTGADLTGNRRKAGATYALASEFEPEYTGPKWIPLSLWQFMEYGDGYERDCARALCAGADAEDLWASLSLRYPEHTSMPFQLTMACAEAKETWDEIPQMNPAQFRKQRRAFAREAERLAAELERFSLGRDPCDRDTDGLLDFTDLLSQEERDNLDHSIRLVTFDVANRALFRVGFPRMEWATYNEDIGPNSQSNGVGAPITLARADAWRVYDILTRDHIAHRRGEQEYFGVPTLPDLLRRIAQKFDSDGEKAPLAQRNRPSAERNFFAEHLCKSFQRSFGGISPSIVSRIVCLFYPEGIDENAVSQIARKVRREHPVPDDPLLSRDPEVPR